MLLFSFFSALPSSALPREALPADRISGSMVFFLEPDVQGSPMCPSLGYVTAARSCTLCMAILVKIKVANNGVRVVCSSCVKWEYLGQGGFNPVKTDRGGGKGKVRASAA